MSFENTQCPCGGKKPTDTMLCDLCVDFVKERKEWKIFNDYNHGLEYRRHAAVILLTLARTRIRETEKLQKPLPLSYETA